MSYGVDTSGQSLHDRIEHDAAMLGEDFVDATHFRHERGPERHDSPLEFIKSRPVDLSHGQSLIALMDCILEGREFSVAIRRAEPNLEQYEKMAAGGVTSVRAAAE